MKRLMLALIAVIAAPAGAQTVRVTSGEHDGFTRLVADFGRPVDWEFGRDVDGYLLRTQDGNVSFDLTNAFALIGKSRLAALEAPSSGGGLKIGMACACHAIPFEFRPGTIVIDLKDGPPPKDSVFEAELRQTQMPQSAQENEPSSPVAPAPYDWTRDALTSMRTNRLPADRRNPQPPPAKDQVLDERFTLPPPDPGLQPLRDNLVEQLAIGASQGVIEFNSDLPQSPLSDAEYPSAQIRIGAAQTKVSAPQKSVPEDLGSQGAICIDDAMLDLASWGDDTVALTTQISDLRTTLSREFDTVDPETLAKSVKLLLYLGFGAEARQEIQAFDLRSGDRDVLRALSFLLDDDTQGAPMFRGQAACGGPAALWAFLSDDTLKKGDPVNEKAIRLAFSSLPMHLRKLLGPRLADRFLEFGNTSAARALNDAIGRAQGEPDNRVALMQAELELGLGAAEGAETLATAVLADPGQEQQQALISLTASRVAQGLPVSQDVVIALETHLSESAGTASELRLKEALMLAQAASGDFPAAFKSLPDFPERTDVVWGLLTNLAPDEEFLATAVLDPAAAHPDLKPETVQAISKRLAELGLGRTAARWLADVQAPDAQLASAIALQNRDVQAALSMVAAENDESSAETRLRAFELAGDFAKVASLHAASGNVAAETVALAKLQDWQALATKDEGVWQVLAAELTAAAPGADPAAAGDLARGHALIDAAIGTRAGVETLLSQVPLPAPVSE